jgi:hypothetical protein
LNKNLTFTCLLFSLLFLSKITSQNSLPSQTWDAASNYTFMYYPETLAGGTDFHIQTNQHFLAFDYERLHLKDLRRIKNPKPEIQAVRENLDFLPLVVDQDLFSGVLRYQGKAYKLVEGPSKPADCQLIESGKYFQRRNLINLHFEQGAPPVEAALEIVSWPDRIVFVLKVTSKTPLNDITLEMRTKFSSQNRDKIFQDKNNFFGLDAKGDGFLYAPVGKTTGKLQDTTFICSKTFTAANEFQMAFTAIPVTKYQKSNRANTVLEDASSIQISPVQIAPFRVNLESRFNPVYGWHEIKLRNDKKEGNGIERVLFTVENTSDATQQVRLNFSKTQVAGITGISAILRDKNQNPIGIPIQISKNWHNQKKSEFMGPWFRGFTMLSIAAHKKIDLELTLANAYWGTVPAASHAQLCLSGWGNSWGNNQLWEQSAIGAFGESICYEPEGGQAQTMITDQRPLFVESTDVNVKRPQQYNWTPNVGGADFFRFYDENGKKQHIKRIKTHYKRNCPNLTEVSYVGTTSKGEADYELTTSIYRSDDYVRGVYKIKLNVKDTLNFSRLAVVQMGSDTYAYTGDNKFAFGDENGLIEEWDTQWGDSEYRKKGLHTQGKMPWVSLHENVNRDPNKWGTSANRGLLVKSWSAQVGGKKTSPYFSEFGAKARGENTSLLELNMAEGTTQLLPGDFIEAELVQLILPVDSESYYGPNKLFKKELKANANTWKPVYRELLGNTLKIKASKGKVEHSFPVVVAVNKHNEAQIDIEGGIGYVPVTFTGLSSYTDHKLVITKNGKKVSLDQSVHGNDYWQTDYDPVSKTWEITYSVLLD